MNNRQVAINIAIKVLEQEISLHYNACFEDTSGRHDLNAECVCSIGVIVNRLKEIQPKEK